MMHKCVAPDVAARRSADARARERVRATTPRISHRRV